jgi:hypothetical protein
MSSNISDRRRVEPPVVPPEPLEPPELPELPAVPLLEDVEYLLVVDPDDWVVTSVPNSVQSEQSSSSAPSTLVVVSDDCSAPHISHWAIPG